MKDEQKQDGGGLQIGGNVGGNVSGRDMDNSGADSAKIIKALGLLLLIVALAWGANKFHIAGWGVDAGNETEEQEPKQ